MGLMARPTGFVLFVLLVMMVAFAGCGGGSTVIDEPDNEPTAQYSSTTATGTATIVDADAGVEVQATVENDNGRALSGVQVGMVALNNLVVVTAFDQEGKYFPATKVVPHAGHTSSQAAGEYLRVDVFLVLSEVGEGVPGIFFNYDPPIFDLAAIEPGVVTQMAGVEVAAQEVIPLGGTITLKCLTSANDYKLINLNFGKDWTVANVVNELANYLDITRDYEISTHELFPRYVEIQAGKTGDLYDTESGIEYVIQANGDTATGEVGTVTVTNNSELEYRLIIVPGTTFENSNIDHQNLTVINTTVVLTAPGETVSAPVYGACVHRHKAGPQPQDTWTPMLDQRSDLVLLCILIDQIDPPLGVLQDAIWVITDNNDPKPQNLEAVIQLFRAAGLDPQDYDPLRDHDGGDGGDI